MVNRDVPVKTKVGRGTFTISPETTFVTQPRDANGYPDYVTALNERLRDGVTRDNNACVPMWRVLGSNSEGANPPDAVFQMLGIDRLPSEDKVRFVSQSDFAKERLGIDPQSPEMAEIYNQSERIRKRSWTRNEYP